MNTLLGRLALTTAILLYGKTLAFSSSPGLLVRGPRSSRSSPTFDEFVAKPRRATSTNLNDEEAQRPKIFEEVVYADIASAYEKLDKRFNDGPSSLTAADLHDLESELSRIGDEMSKNEHKRPLRSSSQSLVDDGTTIPTATSNTFEQDTDNTAAEHVGPRGFDGKFGVADGTTNTYVIDGMDEMTAEEYQVAIQEAVSAKQRQRRATGMVGGQTSQNYMNNLGNRN